MNKLFILFFAVILFSLASCIEEKNTEDEQPVIELISPMPCDTLYFGESFKFKIRITDNSGLGNISMDLHNNFGRHSHGSHVACNMDEPKDAINPFEDDWLFSLPASKKDYTFETDITFEAFKEQGVLFDSGDYHFHIYVTDNEGYQVFTSLDVKILNK